MPTVRNARSLVTSRELRAGFKSGGKDQLNALFSVGTMKADTDSASAESVKVIQGRVAHGTLYVRLTCPTMDNHHNKPRSSSRILTVRNFKFNLSTFRHFRNKIKSVDCAFLDFPCPQAWWSLNKPSGCAFGLANDSTKPFGHGKSKKARLSRLYTYNHSTTHRLLLCMRARIDRVSITCVTYMHMVHASRHVRVIHAQ